jgi:hypothetical protein
MGTENTLDLLNGELYILGTDNTSTYLGPCEATIASCPQCTVEDEDFSYIHTINTTEATFSFDITWDKWVTYNIIYNINWLFGGTKMLHLAKYSKQHRIRNKNRNRIMKIIDRSAKCD